MLQSNEFQRGVQAALQVLQDCIEQSYLEKRAYLEEACAEVSKLLEEPPQAELRKTPLKPRVNRNYAAGIRVAFGILDMHLSEEGGEPLDDFISGVKASLGETPHFKDAAYADGIEEVIRAVRAAEDSLPESSHVKEEEVETLVFYLEGLL